MAASSVRCHVLDADVTVITNLEGRVTNVVCPQFNRLTHSCALKAANKGFVSTVAAKASDLASGSRLNYCEFGDPHNSTTARIVDRVMG